MTFQPKEIPTTEDLIKSGLCGKNRCKEEVKNEIVEKKITRKGYYVCIPFCVYSSITEFAKANNIPVPKARDRRAALIARGMKAEDITADDIINFVSMRGKHPHTKSSASIQQNVDNSKLDTSAIKQALQQEGEFKGEEEKTEEKLDEITQFENKERKEIASQFVEVNKMEQKYNEGRIGDLEVEVKQLSEDVDNIKAMIAKIVKGEFAGAGDVKLKKVIKQLLKEILVELND